MKRSNFVAAFAATTMIFCASAQNISYLDFAADSDDLAGYTSLYNTENSRNDSMLLQQYNFADFTELNGTVDINSIKSRYFITTGVDGLTYNAELVIYDKSLVGTPNNLLFSTPLTLTNTDNGDGSNYKDITTPVTGVSVTDDFFVGIRTNGSTDKIAFYVSKKGTVEPNSWLYGPSGFGLTDYDWRLLTSRHATELRHFYFELNVSEQVANQAPTPQDDAVTTAQDTPVTTDVLANDTDTDGTLDITTVTITVDATNGTTSVDPVTGEVTYTPNAGYFGTDSYTYQVCDKGSPQECATATVTITVTEVVPNEAPVATDDNGVMVHSEVTTVAILDNDTDPNETVTFSTHTVDLDLATAGIQSTFSAASVAEWSYDVATGILTCTPDASVVVGETLTLTYQLCDSDGACDDGIVSLNVVADIDERVVITKTYPNPVQDVMHIETINSNALNANIIGLDGKVISSLIINQDAVTVPSIAAGMYVLEVSFENGSVSRTTFIKE